MERYRHWRRALGYHILFPPVTYIYLIPGRGLGENTALSPKDMIPYRLFVVKEGGPQIVIHNVTVTLRDETDPTQANNERIEHFGEIDPGPLPEGAQPPHFWNRPLKPWDADYKIAFTSLEAASTERIRIGCSDASHEVFLAIRILSGNGKPMLSCRDQPFAHLPEWKSDDERSCSALVPPPPQFEATLYPRPYVLSLPSSLIDMSPNQSSSGWQIIGRAFACPKIVDDDSTLSALSDATSDSALFIEVGLFYASMLVLISLVPVASLILAIHYFKTRTARKKQSIPGARQ
jgi:hypothetical protein